MASSLSESKTPPRVQLGGEVFADLINHAAQELKHAYQSKSGDDWPKYLAHTSNAAESAYMLGALSGYKNPFQKETQNILWRQFEGGAASNSSDFSLARLANEERKAIKDSLDMVQGRSLNPDKAKVAYTDEKGFVTDPKIKGNYYPTDGVVDPYSYPKTWVLKNKFDIRDKGELELLEGTLTAIRAGEGLPAGNFDYAHLKAIHKHLFQDLYDWAGDERTIVTAKRANKTPFPEPGKIEDSLHKTFEQLNKDNLLKGLKQEAFSEKIADLITDINAAHPFREGNGRTMREFANLVANQAGYEIDWAAVDKDRWNDANVQHSYGDPEPMRALMRDVVVTLEQAQAPDSMVNKLGRKAYSSTQLRQLYPELIDMASKLALQEKIEQASDGRRMAAYAFMRLPPDKTLEKFPALTKHYELWGKAQEQADKNYPPGSKEHGRFLDGIRGKIVGNILGVKDSESTRQNNRASEAGHER